MTKDAPTASPPPRRLLVLGTSGSAGSTLSNPEHAWPYLVHAGLTERCGPIELVNLRFATETDGALAYLDRKLREFPAEWVVLLTTGYPITARTVPYRINRWLGRERMLKTEGYAHRFDRATGRGSPLLRPVNRSVHWLARRVIGTATLARYESIVGSYAQAITRLSRLESALVTIIGAGLPRSPIARGNPAAIGDVARFNAELSEAARRHRMAWVDHDAPGTVPGPEHDSLFVDLAHKVKPGTDCSRAACWQRSMCPRRPRGGKERGVRTVLLGLCHARAGKVAGMIPERTAVSSERYAIERPIGAGGAAEVWLAQDRLLGRQVALKRLRPEPGMTDDALEREARILAGLSHPNIVPVHDLAEVEGVRYLVLEYVPGRSLREGMLEAPLSEAAAVGLGVQVAAALDYAHERGVLHNDVKPDNILIDDAGTARLTDFGIAEAHAHTLTPTEARELMGTVAYIAPEVIQGEAPTKCSDVYSLGVTLFEAVSGQLPFRSGLAVLANPGAAAAPDLREFAPVSAEFARTIGRALAPGSKARFATAGDFAAALERGSGNQTRPLQAAAASAAAALATTPAHAPTPSRPASDPFANRESPATSSPREGGTKAAIAGGAAVAAVAGGAVLAARSSSDPFARSVAGAEPASSRRTRAVSTAKTANGPPRALIGVAVAIGGVALLAGAAAVTATRGDDSDPGPDEALAAQATATALGGTDQPAVQPTPEPTAAAVTPRPTKAPPANSSNVRPGEGRNDSKPPERDKKGEEKDDKDD